MNYKEIDILKSIFSNMLKNQNTLRSIDFGIDGKLIAIGYNPYWTSRYDSKIEKLELNFLSSRGVMVPLVLKNIVDFEIYPKEGRRNKKYRINNIELIILSPYMNPRNLKDIYDKVKIEIIYDD
ncbi:MAG: hypothetical protein ACYDG2_23490 [Ruminiclostridium sp.]